MPDVRTAYQTANTLIARELGIAGEDLRNQYAVYGRATVIDGDELEIDGQRVKLWGIQVPPRTGAPRMACATANPQPETLSPNSSEAGESPANGSRGQGRQRTAPCSRAANGEHTPTILAGTRSDATSATA